MSQMSNPAPFNLHVDLGDQATLNFSAQDFGLKLTGTNNGIKQIALRHNSVSGILYSAVVRNSRIRGTLEYNSAKRETVELAEARLTGDMLVMDIVQ